MERWLPTVTQVLRFAPEDVSLADRGRYTSVGLARGVPEDATGAPSLPCRKYFVVVPAGARPGVLEVRSVESGLVIEHILVEPIQPSELSRLAPLARRVGPDRAIYDSEVSRPQVPARLVAARRLGPYSLVEFTVCPVRYHPRQRRLELLTRLEVAMPYEAPDAAPEPSAPADHELYAAKMAERVRRIVINPEDVDRFIPHFHIAVGIPQSRRTSQVEHVIITNHNLAGSFDRLSTWRNQLGTSSRVVLTTDILTNQVPGAGSAVFNLTSGYYDGGTRDAAEAIRNFVKWASVNWNTDYVLLGGDTDVVPERHALATLEGKFYPGGDFAATDMQSQVGFWPVASSELPGSPATSVVDDQPTTWECAAGDANPWIRLEMRPSLPVNKVSLSWGATHASGYVLAVSRDGINWTDVSTATAGAAGTVEIGFRP